MNRYSFEGRCAVVTGGASGLGYGIAERFAASGARVCIWDIDGDKAEQAAATLREAGGAVTSTPVDICDAQEVSARMTSDIEKMGGLSILVNSAGITGPNNTTWDYDVKDWRQVIEINLVGTYICCAAAVPHMKAGGYGRVVNIASVAGKEGNPNASAYSASKAGVIGFTKSLGKELADTDVRVNCITPAAVSTPMFAQMSQEHIDYMLSKIPLRRFGEVSEIASMVCWLASEECSFTTGGVFDISGGRATY